MCAMVTEFAVHGMSCEHCVDRVTSEISRLDGVSGVSIDLPTGRVLVTSSTALERGAVSSAVDEAGYDLVDA
jgi:copper chaperone